jgi:hypothetical protein
VRREEKRGKERQKKGIRIQGSQAAFLSLTLSRDCRKVHPHNLAFGIGREKRREERRLWQGEGGLFMLREIPCCYSHWQY